LVRQINPQECGRYIFLIIKSMLDATPWIEPYPKHFELILENGLVMLRELTEFITATDNQEIITVFIQLMSYFFNLNMKMMKELSAGTMNGENHLEKSFDICKTFLVNMRGGLKFIHRTQQVKNIELILNERLQEKEQYLA
jgi:hypothetical protein